MFYNFKKQENSENYLNININIITNKSNAQLVSLKNMQLFIIHILQLQC
jgi:hypothetical protein